MVPKMLVVDDKEETRQILSESPTREGCQAVFAASGDESLMLAQRDNPGESERVAAYIGELQKNGSAPLIVDKKANWLKTRNILRIDNCISRIIVTN